MNQPRAFAARQVAHAAAHLLGTPVDADPLRIVEGFANENCAGLDGRPLRIFEFVDGVSPETLAPTEAARFWRALGTIVQQLHSVALPAFTSRLDGTAPTFTTWIEYLGHRLGQISERVARGGCFAATQLDHLWRQLLRTVEGIRPAIAPRLVHRDLHVGNLLATPAGEVACVLDFDLAEAWDPAAEFFKLRYFAFADHATREAAFMAGYGDAERRLTGFETRVLAACCLEFVNMTANDALANDRAGVEWSHARLDALLRQASWPRLEHRRD